MRTRRIVLAALITLVTLLVVGYGVASATVYDSLAKVSGDCHPEWAGNSPTAFVAPSDVDMDMSPYLMPAPQEVTIVSRDPGIEVSGWWLPADEPDAPAVIVVHGLTACKRDPAVLLPAGMLHRNGFSVLLIDLRDHGDSTFEDGRYAGGTEEQRDVLGAWDWLREEQAIPEGRIGLLGMSLGAATTLIATGQEPRVAATWADSSYADLPAMIRDELAREGYPTFLEMGAVLTARIVSGDDLAYPSPLDSVHLLAGRPVFLAHGTADERINIRYGRELADAIKADGGNVELWEVEGAAHTQAEYTHADEYEQRLVDFFRGTIGAS